MVTPESKKDSLKIMKITTQKEKRTHANVQSCPSNEKREFAIVNIFFLIVLNKPCSLAH